MLLQLGAGLDGESFTMLKRSSRIMGTRATFWRAIDSTVPVENILRLLSFVRISGSTRVDTKVYTILAESLFRHLMSQDDVTK